MKHFWTEDELKVLRREYPDTPNKDLAVRMGRSISSVYGKARFLGLRKSKEYIKRYCRMHRGDQRGKATQFKKGNQPHNSGKIGWSAGGNSLKTRFRKGDRPYNWAPIGSERISKDGIVQRKITDTGHPSRDWKSVHGLVWESHNGPLPVGHIVVFKNGDRMDIRIENLELISRAENMRRNTIHNLPEAIVDVCRIKGVLNRHINERMKSNEKQN